MAYGTDFTVFVEDSAGDQGAPGSPAPWWLSPDVDIPAHSGTAAQGSNDVKIRVHAREEPIIDEKIVAEVYVGNPSLVMSAGANTKRIDPGNLLFRPANVAGTEPVADVAGGTLTFAWTPSSVAADLDGPGHRCLVLRAFPESVVPDAVPFDVPNEQHEAQHNMDILTTTNGLAPMPKGGAGTPQDPRRRDEQTGLWWERISTMAVLRPGTRFVVWAVDPTPARHIESVVRHNLGKEFDGFSDEPPQTVELEAEDTKGEQIEPARLLEEHPELAESAGIGGKGLFARDRLVAAATVDLSADDPSDLLLRFDHSNLRPRTAVVLHGAQWNERGSPEGGITVVVAAPPADADADSEY
jgi:hypothetical protein